MQECIVESDEALCRRLAGASVSPNLDDNEIDPRERNGRDCVEPAEWLSSTGTGEKGSQCMSFFRRKMKLVGEKSCGKEWMCRCGPGRGVLV